MERGTAAVGEAVLVRTADMALEGAADETMAEEAEAASVTGQMVVVTSTISVMTGEVVAGQSVIVAAHSVMVDVLVKETVRVVRAAGELEPTAATVVL